MNLEQLVEWEFTGEAKLLKENPPQSHFIPQNLDVLPWYWTQATVMESQWLTAWAMAQLVVLLMAMWFLLTLDVCCSSVTTQSRNMIMYLHPHDELLHLLKFLFKFWKTGKTLLTFSSLSLSLSLFEQLGIYGTDSSSTRAIVFVLWLAKERILQSWLKFAIWFVGQWWDEIWIL